MIAPPGGLSRVARCRYLSPPGEGRQVRQAEKTFESTADLEPMHRFPTLHAELNPMATAKQYTKDDILALVRSNPSAVQRGILALYERQGEDERAFGIAKQRNRAGFSQGTAPMGSKIARSLLAGHRLDEDQLRVAQSIVEFHAGQLARIANDQVAARHPDAGDSSRLKHQRKMYDDVVRDIEKLLGRPVIRDKFNETVKRRAAALGDSTPEGVIGVAQEILEDLQARKKK